MKTNIITIIEHVTKTFNLGDKAWPQIVDEVILPKMAGQKNLRWCINDRFINLVTGYADEILAKDISIAMSLFEIVLQRLSCGAVLHPDDPTTWPQPLPEKYWAYSSCYDEPHVMTEGCYNFIIKRLETCLQYRALRKHALAIVFGLMEYLTPEGNTVGSGYMLGKFKDKGQILYQHAETLAEKYATFDELYTHYVRPGQWQKHVRWFSRNQALLDWKQFFQDTGTLNGNWFKRRKQAADIKKRIQQCCANA